MGVTYAQQGLLCLGLLAAVMPSTSAAQGSPPKRPLTMLAGSAATGRMPPRAAWEVGGTPPALQAYLKAAKAADRIVDPLARCLAFPDYPGAHWPAGLAVQQCRQANAPVVTLAQMRALIDGGKAAALDAMLKAHLDRHFSTTDFSEIIHADFKQFDGSYDSGKLTKDWLAKAPNSAYAAMARGAYFEAQAYESRGTAWASQTPPENMVRMREFAAKAQAELKRALAIEPRMMPAYSAQISLARNVSDEATVASAWAAGTQRDRACSELARAGMVALQPRWGGSYPQMLALAKSLSPDIPRRPLLAQVTVMPKFDAASVLYRDKKYDEAEAMLRSAIAESSNPAAFEALARYQANRLQRLPTIEGLSYLLAASRFRDCDCDPALARQRGDLLLMVMHDPQWAQLSLRRTLARTPDDMEARLSLAMADSQAGDQAAAEAGYLLAMKDAKFRDRALQGLVELFMRWHRFDKARIYNDLVIKAHPADAWAAYQRAQIATATNTGSRADLQAQIAALERFLVLSQDPTVPPFIAAGGPQAQRDLSQAKARLQAMGPGR